MHAVAICGPLIGNLLAAFVAKAVLQKCRSGHRGDREIAV